MNSVTRPCHRLAEVSYGTAKRVAYGMDQFGNHTLVDETVVTGPTTTALARYSHTNNSLNQVTRPTKNLPSPSVITDFTYDNNGNRLTETTGTNVYGCSSSSFKLAIRAHRRSAT
jgi:hypothetical protein